MSIEKNLWDIDNLADLVLDGLGPIKSVVSDFFGGDLFSGDGVYPAVVISNAVNITPSEYTALGFPNFDASADRTYKKFKVRIINKRNNPHAMLENPCDLSTAMELCQQNSLIASHTTVATHGAKGIGIGTLVEIKLDKLPNDTYNLQTAHFQRVLQPNDTGHQILSKAACDSMSRMFEHGEAYEPPPEITISSDLLEWADKYDAGSVPQKGNHAKHLREIEQAGWGFHFYVKAFFYLAWSRHGIEIIFTPGASGVRTAGTQKRLQNKTKVSGYDGLPAAKTSLHMIGSAMDINFKLPAGKSVNGQSGWIGSHKATGETPSQNKQTWEMSGLVSLGVEVGLEWGGNFKHYDPVHFDRRPPGVTNETIRMHAGGAPPPMRFGAGSDDPLGESQQQGTVTGEEADAPAAFRAAEEEEERFATSEQSEEESYDPYATSPQTW